MTDISDNELIERIRDGDTDVFAVIVDRYQLQIYNLMLRSSGSVDDAADMTQDLFCRAFDKLDRYSYGKSFFAWLYTLAINHARDWAKKRQREGWKRQHAFDVQVNEGSVSLEEAVDRKAAMEALGVALETLPQDRVELVVLRYRYERPIKEIAEIFGISQSAVKMRLQRTLRELSEQLKERR